MTHLETADERTAREEAEWQAQQIEQARQREDRVKAHRLNKVSAELAHYTTWRDQLTGWKADVEARLAVVMAHLETVGDRIARQNLTGERDSLRDTLTDITGGWSRYSCGQLLALAQAAGVVPLPGCVSVFERRPGLVKTLSTIAALEEERERLS